MRKTKYLKRETVETMIKNEGYRFVVNFVSACFQDIYVYYKRIKKDYFVIMHEHTDESWSNCRIHSDLLGFLETMNEIEASTNKLLSLAIEDGDVNLEKALQTEGDENDL